MFSNYSDYIFNVESHGICGMTKFSYRGRGHYGGKLGLSRPIFKRLRLEVRVRTPKSQLLLAQSAEG